MRWRARSPATGAVIAHYFYLTHVNVPDFMVRKVSGVCAGCAIVGNSALVYCWGPVATQFLGLTQVRRLESDHQGTFCAIEAGYQVSCWQLGLQPQRVPAFNP